MYLVRHMRGTASELGLNLLRPEKVFKSYFGFFLETNCSRNWAHILSSRSASFQPF